MMMVTALLSLQATPMAPVSIESTADAQARLNQCITLSATNPAAAIDFGNGWIADGGGAAARQCLGIGFLDAGDYRAALTTFSNAGVDAAGRPNPAAAQLWSLAAQAALALGEAAEAQGHATFAIDAGRLSGAPLAAAHVTRARARVALSDLPGARADLDRAKELTPADGTVWLLSATLARRMADGVRAMDDIERAAILSPRDPAVALEAGILAWLYNDYEAARRSFESAIAIDPSGPVAVVARRHMTDMVEEMQASTISRPAPDQPAPVQLPPQSR